MAERVSPETKPVAERRFRLWLAALATAAVAVRLVHVFELARGPLSDLLIGDALSYHRWATELAAGDWLGKAVFYQAPLYPYVLGALYAVTGPSILAVRVLQSILAGLSCVFVGLAGRRWFSDLPEGQAERAGLAAAGLLAFYPPAIFFAGLVQKAALDLVLVTLLVWVLARLADEGRTRDAFAAGLVLGLLSLTRENALALLLVVVAWALLRSGASRWRQVGGVLVGAAVALLPVAARNWAVGGELQLTTAQAGPNFYIGNGPSADGGYVPLRPGREMPEHERVDATELAQAAEGRPLTAGEVSGYWWRQSWQHLREHPGQWALLLGKKALMLLNRYEVPDSENIEVQEEHSLVLALLSPVFGFSAVVALSAAGLALSWGRRRRLALLYALNATYSLAVVAFYVFGRYRFSLVPLLLPFAGAGLVGAFDLWRAHRWRELAVPACAALVGAGASWIPLGPHNPSLAYHNVGVTLIGKGRHAEAIQFLQQAIEADPRNSISREFLGLAYLALGDRQQAWAAFEQAVALAPGGALIARNRMCVMLAEARDFSRAEQCLEDVLRLDPKAVDARVNRGIVAAQTGRVAEARRWFDEALGLDPRSVPANLGMARLLSSQGRGEDAKAFYRKALEIEPRNVEARRALGDHVAASDDAK